MRGGGAVLVLPVGSAASARALFMARALHPGDFPLLGGDPLVMFLAPHRIVQRRVGSVDDRHDARGFFIAGIFIGVVFLAQRLVGCANDFLRRHARHFEVVIMRMNFGHNKDDSRSARDG
jgi:hypothetical protein